MLAAKEELKTYEDYAGAIKINMTKEEGKKFPIGPYITGTRNTILTWTHASEKKPATAVQTIKLSYRPALPIETVTVDTNKNKVSLDAKFERYDEKKKKWSAAKNLTATEDTAIRVRLKANVKGGKEDTKITSAELLSTPIVTE